MQFTLDSTLCDGRSEIECTPSKVDPDVISPPQPIGRYLVDESVVEGTADQQLPRRKPASTDLN